MKNLILLIVFFFFINNLKSQNHRFFYDFEYKMDTIGTASKEILVLMVNDTENLFLSNKFVETDSINNIQQYKKIYRYPQYSNVLKYSQKDKIFTTYKKIDIDYYKYEFSTQLNWKIESEKKEILGFPVQKATTKYGGRNWIAWFCPEIQLSYGPYIFYNLPGLVLEVYDDKANFHYTLVKNLNTLPHNFKLESVFEQKPIRIDAEDWGTVQTNFYNNPLYIYKTIGWIIYNKKGERYTPQDYRELESQIKDNLKKYNNPIELDEKVNFK